MAKEPNGDPVADDGMSALTSNSPGDRSSDSVIGAAPQALRDVERLLDIYDRMLGNVQIEQVLQDIAGVVCENFDAERASIYLIDRETDELESVAVIGNVARTIRVPIRDSSLAGFCALTGRSFFVSDAYGDLGEIDPKLRFDRTWDEANRFRTRDVMCSPARYRGEILGVVQLINSTAAPFGESDLAQLQTVSRLIAYALHFAQLYDDLATMKQLEKEKAEFMRVMVHELKSPVAAASMMTDVLLQHPSANDEVRGLGGKISNRMSQLLDLIKDLLELAQVKSGDPLGEISVIDIVEKTAECCTSYRDQADQKGLIFDVSLQEEPLYVRFDEQGYRLVASNLVSNAVKYTTAGSVGVTMRSEGRWAVLEVRDSGIGVPEEEVPRLFREFFRASNAKRDRIPGSGVGLAGAKRLVERFGGEFSLETRENVGSTFTVRLPLNDARS